MRSMTRPRITLAPTREPSTARVEMETSWRGAMSHTPKGSVGDRVYNVLLGAFASGLTLTPLLVPPCGHGLESTSGLTPPRCQLAFQGQGLLAVTALAISVSLWWRHRPDIRRVMGGFLAILGGLALGLMHSRVVGICAHPAMICHRTANWALFWGVLLVATGLLVALSARTSIETRRLPDPWDAARPVSKGGE